MAIEKCYIVHRSADAFPAQVREREYRDYQFEINRILGGRIEGFQKLAAKNIIDFRDPLRSLIQLEGEGNIIDVLIIEDEYKDVASIYKQCELNESIKKILIVDHPDTVLWILNNNIPAPKLITLDFKLIEDDEHFKITQQLYEKIKIKWATSQVIGLTNTENQVTAKELEDKIRANGESVWDKAKFIDNLSHIFRDRLRMHELRMEVLSLQDKNNRLEAENNKLKIQLPKNSGKSYLKGSSIQMRQIYSELMTLSKLKTIRAITIYGTSGTGKSVVARAIAEDMEIKSENCCTIRAAELNENNLVGYVKGGFPGAEADRIGLLTRYNSGVMIVDGLENLAFEIQERLIDVIDNGTFRRQGSFEIEKTFIRIIFLSSTKLDELVKKGTLKKDFYNRIQYPQIQLSDLRTRREDIAELIEYFRTDKERLGKCFGKGDWVCTFEKEAISTLSCYDFPGNVAELEKIAMMAMEQAFYSRLSDSNLIFVRKEHIAGVLTLVPSEKEIEEVESFLNKIEGDAIRAVREFNLMPEKLKQKDLAAVTEMPDYRQKIIHAFLHVGKREEVMKYLLDKFPNKWTHLRNIKPFDKS